MSDRVLFCLPDGRWVALSPEALREALEAGAAAMPQNGAGSAGSPDEPLMDSEQLAAVLNLPVTWIEQASREGKIPSVQAGRWRRYRRAAVESALGRNGCKA